MNRVTKVVESLRSLLTELKTRYDLDPNGVGIPLEAMAQMAQASATAAIMEIFTEYLKAEKPSGNIIQIEK